MRSTNYRHERVDAIAKKLSVQLDDVRVEQQAQTDELNSIDGKLDKVVAIAGSVHVAVESVGASSRSNPTDSSDAIALVLAAVDPSSASFSRLI